jgi:hypothetical protein
MTPSIKTLLILLSFTTLIAGSACKKSNHPGSGNNPPNTTPSVYVLGTTGDSIVYWKDDTAHLVTTTANQPYVTITSMAVANGHVYVCGADETAGPGVKVIATPYLWTDGKPAILPHTSDSATASVVFTDGSDVYVAGTDATPMANAITVWKNGKTSAVFSTGMSTVSGAAINGRDIYIAGDNSPMGGPIFSPVCWKNGVIDVLSNSLFSSTSGICVDKNDVYVSGTIDADAMYWKNGAPISLTSSSSGSSANAITVAGDTLYVVGSINFLGSPSACVWKNGTLFQPHDFLFSTSKATAITVVNKDVFIAGLQYIDRQPYATYWKNYTPTHLGTGGSASAIVVQ